MKLIDIVIRFSPIGVAALFVYTHIIAGLSDPGSAWALRVRGGTGRWRFTSSWCTRSYLPHWDACRRGNSFKGVEEAMLVAFSTASSKRDSSHGAQGWRKKTSSSPSQVSRFVLTIGSTANQNGTALFEGVTVLFLAQFYEHSAHAWAQQGNGGLDLRAGRHRHRGPFPQAQFRWWR